MLPPQSYDNPSLAERDHWVGRKIFRSSLAQAFIKELSAETASTELDRQFKRLLSRYQYKAACEDPGVCGQSFSNGGAVGDKKYTDVLFTYIGSVSRLGSGTDMEALVDRLQHHIQYSENLQLSDSDNELDNGQPVGLVDASSAQLAVESLVAGGSVKPPSDIAKYTALLYEHGQMRCSVPEYEEKQVKSFPQWFSIVVKFQDVEGHGAGPTKKTAKHLASKDACEKLGISQLVC